MMAALKIDPNTLEREERLVVEGNGGTTRNPTW